MTFLKIAISRGHILKFSRITKFKNNLTFFLLIGFFTSMPMQVMPM